MDELLPNRLGCLARGTADDARLAALARTLALPLVADGDSAAFSHWLRFDAGRLCEVRNAPRAPTAPSATCGNG